MRPYTKLQIAAEKTGWNVKSMLRIALEYIRNQNQNEAFADHVDMAVERELNNSAEQNPSQ